jgi:hypothetical protein
LKCFPYSKQWHVDPIIQICLDAMYIWWIWDITLFIIIYLVVKNITSSVQIAYTKYVKLFSSFYFWLWILICSRYFYKFFTINIYFNSSQYYPTLDKTLAMKLSLYLICCSIRLYSCNINPPSSVQIAYTKYVKLFSSF